MKSLIEQSREIRREAERILRDDGLERILRSYGEVKYVGSYELGLMLKRDIDISLINPLLTLKEFHDLAYEVSGLLHPYSMHFRNTRIKPVMYRPPDALYWGFAFADWNIDLWLVAEDYYLESVKYMNRIKTLLSERHKVHILDIKTRAIERSEYGKGFGSREVYRAVLEHGICSYEDFRKYLGEQSH